LIKMIRLIAHLENLFMIFAKIISIKTIKDLKYFSWCAMNLKYMKV